MVTTHKIVVVKMEIPSSLFTVIHLLIVLVIFSNLFPWLLSRFLRRSCDSVLPGPKPWPIIGNLNLIGPLPHRSLHQISLKYGNLVQMKFGSYPVVVASSPETAKLFLKTHDQNFASRPPSAAGKYTAYNSSDIIWSPSGPHWQLGRKIFLQELFNPKSLESYEYIRIEERQAFMLRNLALSGKPVVVKEQVSRFLFSVISRIALGKNYCSESLGKKPVVGIEEFQWMLEELFFLNGAFNVGDWIPWVDFMDLHGHVRRMKALNKRFDRFFNHVISDHRARRELRGEGDFVANDMVDVLLSHESELTLDGVKGFLQDLMAGGSFTPTYVVEWAMSELIKNPDIIKKATQELDRVVGKERWVEESDMQHLHYIDAIMKETMRLHPVAAVIAPHLAIEDCKVAGYDIRKGTRVFINTFSISRDATLWDDPEVFCPERFLGSEIDVKGQSFELMPFGSGRRMCPGHTFALKMFRVSVANLLHGFNWRLPDNMGIDDLGMEELQTLATIRKFPLVAVMEPRLGSRLYQI